MRFSSTILGLAFLTASGAVMLDCGGGSGSTASPSTHAFAYVDPTTSGYRWVQNASSTSTHLILDLVGPSGTQIRGGMFVLSSDATKTSWSTPGTGNPDRYLLAGSALNLGTGTQLLKSQVSGSLLKAAIYQKGTTAPATLGSQPIVSVALDVKEGASSGAVNLTTSSAQILNASGTSQTIPVAVGALSLQ